jgi:hypothetical protein
VQAAVGTDTGEIVRYTKLDQPVLAGRRDAGARFIRPTSTYRETDLCLA